MKPSQASFQARQWEPQTDMCEKCLTIHFLEMSQFRPSRGHFRKKNNSCVDCNTYLKTKSSRHQPRSVFKNLWHWWEGTDPHQAKEKGGDLDFHLDHPPRQRRLITFKDGARVKYLPTEIINLFISTGGGCLSPYLKWW